MTSIDYLGFVAVGEKTPLLVHAEENERETVRALHGADGVIFTEAADMPSLEALLRANEVIYAVLQTPPPLADNPIVAAPSANLEWRQDAKRRLAQALDDREKGDAVFHEDYSFLPALNLETLDSTLERAHRLLDDPATTQEGWEAFLLAMSEAVASLDPDVVPAESDAPDVAPERAPYFSTTDLALTLHRGALGGPPPLARR